MDDWVTDLLADLIIYGIKAIIVLPIIAYLLGLLSLGQALIIFLSIIFIFWLLGLFSEDTEFEWNRVQENYRSENISQKIYSFEDGMEKMAKEYSSKIDYNNPIVRNLAVKIASRHPGTRNVMQIQDIYEYVNKNWKYICDPVGEDYLAKASETIENGFAGDCDDYAILMSALLLAIGFWPRIVIAGDYHDSHAYPEVYLGAGEEGRELANYISAQIGEPVYWVEDYDGKCWLSLDWTSWHIGGTPMKTNRIVDIYPDGSYTIY